MHFDFFSCVGGAVLSGIVSFFLIRSEKESLVNRIAYNCCQKAESLIEEQKLLFFINNPEAKSLPENFDTIPIENDEFIIKMLKTEENFAQTEKFISVYSKDYNMSLIIVDMLCHVDDKFNRITYYISNKSFTKTTLIKKPYIFDASNTI